MKKMSKMANIKVIYGFEVDEENYEKLVGFLLPDENVDGEFVFNSQGGGEEEPSDEFPTPIVVMWDKYSSFSDMEVSERQHFKKFRVYDKKFPSIKCGLYYVEKRRRKLEGLAAIVGLKLYTFDIEKGDAKNIPDLVTFKKFVAKDGSVESFMSEVKEIFGVNSSTDLYLMPSKF